MTFFTRKSVHILSLSITVGIGSNVAMKVDAQEQEYTPVDVSRQFSAATGEKVSTALEFLNSKNYDAAINELSETLTFEELTPYEYGMIYQVQGSAFYESKMYPQAIQAFEAAISSGGLLRSEVSIYRLNISQLLIANGEFEKGAIMLEKWGRDGGKLTPQHLEVLRSVSNLKSQ